MNTTTTHATNEYVIFYADDDDDDLQLVQEAFDEYASNTKMITASDGVEAIEYLTRVSEAGPVPCLILLDLNMPKLNGKEVLKKLRGMKRFVETPIVLFTTSSLPNDKAVAEEFNAGFVTKPDSPAKMMAIVEKFLARCQDEVKKGILKRNAPAS